MRPYAYELMRLRTLRSTKVLAGLSLVFCLVVGFFARPFLGNEPTGEDWNRLFVIAVPTVVALCSAFIGVFAFGHEFRYGTIRPTLTALPHRVPLGVAKIVVAALSSLVLALLGNVVVFGLSWALAGSRVNGSVLSATTLRVVIGTALYAMGFALFGAGITAAFRNQVVAIVLVIVMPLIVENTLFAVLVFINAFNSIEQVANYLPFSSGSAMYRIGENVDLDLKPLSPVSGGAVFFAWALVICALGLWRFKRSDA
jgi:ABC-2 type transport system permease protein